MSAIEILRVLSWHFAQSAVRPGGKRDPTSRSPDKSTAVGRGACGWIDRDFCAAHGACKTALPPGTPGNLDTHAPSPRLRHQTGW